MTEKTKSCLERMEEMKYVDATFLRANSDCIFVFGDSLERLGKVPASQRLLIAKSHGFCEKSYIRSTSI